MVNLIQINHKKSIGTALEKVLESTIKDLNEMIEYINLITQLHEKDNTHQSLTDELGDKFKGFTYEETSTIYNEFLEVSGYTEKLYNLLLTRAFRQQVARTKKEAETIDETSYMNDIVRKHIR